MVVAVPVLFVPVVLVPVVVVVVVAGAHLAVVRVLVVVAVPVLFVPVVLVPVVLPKLIAHPLHIEAGRRDELSRVDGAAHAREYVRLFVNRAQPLPHLESDGAADEVNLVEDDRVCKHELLEGLIGRCVRVVLLLLVKLLQPAQDVLGVD